MLKDFGYSSVNLREIDKILHMYIFYSLILCAKNSTVVFILRRQKQRMKHMPRSKVSPLSLPNTRASQTTLLLVSTFVCFYLLSYICPVWLVIVYNPIWFLLIMSIAISGCFSTMNSFFMKGIYLTPEYWLHYLLLLGIHMPHDHLRNTQCTFVHNASPNTQSCSHTLQTMIIFWNHEWQKHMRTYLNPHLFLFSLL